MTKLKTICKHCSKVPSFKVIQELRRNPVTQNFEMTSQRAPLFDASPCCMLDSLYAHRDTLASNAPARRIVDRQISAREAYAKAHGHPIRGSVAAPARVVHPA